LVNIISINISPLPGFTILCIYYLLETSHASGVLTAMTCAVIKYSKPRSGGMFLANAISLKYLKPR